MSRWICSYCRTMFEARATECANCGGPVRRATREEAERFGGDDE